MKNNNFKITFDSSTGGISSIISPNDKYAMNWVSEGALWGLINCDNLYEGLWGLKDHNAIAKTELISFIENETDTTAIYSNKRLECTVKTFFDNNGNIRQRFILKNISDKDLFLNEDTFSVSVPFNDSYPDAETCMTNRCNAQIWCGKNTTYINALKMGPSDINLGLVVTEGSFDSYTVSAVKSNWRGVFWLNISPTDILPNEEKTFEWVLFFHKGNEDFIKKAKSYPQFINIISKYYTIFIDETITFTAELPRKCENVSVTADKKSIDFTKDNNNIIVNLKPDKTGDIRFTIVADDIKTYADFTVKPSFEEIVEKRVNYIIEHQQYHREGSALDGAFLVYDPKIEHFIFDDNIGDHNACYERLGMGLLVARYLRTHKNEKAQKALDKYIEFIFREIYDENTGIVHNTVGKNTPIKSIRLYHAPWVSHLLTEVYFLTKDTYYLKENLKLMKFYYINGGIKFYPNGFSYINTIKAYEDAGLTNELKEATELFKAHADNIAKKGVLYPKHEVNYEQTIVSPAATFVSEICKITGDNTYLEKAYLHISVLERFNGHQPSFHLNEIPIRYWDDFWFGKRNQFGDTFPHYWSCLTARSFVSYYNISGEEKYLEAAKKCMRNCLCLFFDDGHASCAYVYPHKINDKSGEFYDEWANDQDFALFFALETNIFNTDK